MQQIKILEDILQVEVVDTIPAIKKGLAGVKELADDYGMLFKYPRIDSWFHWMKGMEIAIDIIWIKDGVIVGYNDEVKPEKGKTEDDLINYNPPEPIKTVLEVRSGLRREKNWQIGDKVELV